MSVIYRDEFNDWGVEKDESNKLFFYYFDSGMGGVKKRIEIGEDQLNFALENKPDMYVMYEYVKNGNPIKNEKANEKGDGVNLK